MAEKPVEIEELEPHLKRMCDSLENLAITGFKKIIDKLVASGQTFDVNKLRDEFQEAFMDR